MAQDNERNKKQGGNPQNNPPKPMNSKREVEQSPDQKIDQDFPGYPHYPSKEDIMDKRTDIHQVDMDVENLPNSRNVSGVSQRFDTYSRQRGTDQGQERKEKGSDDFSDLNPRTESGRDGLATLDTTNDEVGTRQNIENDDLHLGGDDNVSDDERRTLASNYYPTGDEDNLENARLDDRDFDGEKLNEESFGEMRTAAGLDIPDETDETTTTSLGQGDEENKYYSLGGDRQEGNEEDPYSGPQRS